MAEQWEYRSEFAKYMGTEVVSKYLPGLGDVLIHTRLDNFESEVRKAEEFLMQKLNEFGGQGWEVLEIAGGTPNDFSGYMVVAWNIRLKRRKL